MATKTADTSITFEARLILLLKQQKKMRIAAAKPKQMTETMVLAVLFWNRADDPTSLPIG